MAKQLLPQELLLPGSLLPSLWCPQISGGATGPGLVSLQAALPCCSTPILISPFLHLCVPLAQEVPKAQSCPEQGLIQPEIFVFLFHCHFLTTTRQ